MKRERGGDDADAAAAASAAVVVPALPLDLSDIPAVQELIQANNNERRARRRMRAGEFVNHAFCTLGTAVPLCTTQKVNSVSSSNSSSTSDSDDDDVRAAAALTMRLLDECVTRHKTLPRSTSLGKVLHAWLEHRHVREGVALVQAVLAARERVPAAAFAAALDERVATLALRLYAASDTHATRGHVTALLSLLPTDVVKRRVFASLFACAAQQQQQQQQQRCNSNSDEGEDEAVSFAFALLHDAQQRHIELWDSDYKLLLELVTRSRACGALTRASAAARATQVLTAMAEQHPVVGSDNASLLRGLLGGQECHVRDADGQCDVCAQRLCSFDLDDDDRQSLLHDIVEKLIKPRMLATATALASATATASTGVQSNDKVTTPTTTMCVPDATMWAVFDKFVQQLHNTSYDTVIDGANVGYYGLSRWYSTAKTALLRRRGVDVARVPLRERTVVPVPVDVAPKFALIEQVRLHALQQGRRPLIVLHARHVHDDDDARDDKSNEAHEAHDSEEQSNAALLRRWRAARALLASPPFLNDDYCWLYAAVARPGTMVVSNDQMRDHHFSILQPRFFLRWRQRHRITYRVFYQQATQHATVALRMPAPYSVWVQPALAAATAAVALVTRGHNNNTKADDVDSRVTHWHIPYLADVPVLQQATNHTSSTDADVGLSKDGDDVCSAWLCTAARVGNEADAQT